MAKKAASQKQEEKLLKFKYYIVNLKIRHLNSTKDLTPIEYSEIFRAFYDAGIPGKSSRQKECVLITRVEQEIPNRAPVFWGQIVEVTNVNNKRWFDKQEKKIDDSFSIPTKYAANAHQTEYVFIPLTHRFCYQFKSSDLINPYSVKNYLKDALDKFFATTGAEYLVQVDVETDDATINRILEAEVVERVKVKINYSNNDFGKEVKEFIENDLKTSNVGEIEINATHK